MADTTEIKNEDLKYLLEMLRTCAGNYSFAENVDRSEVEAIAKRTGFKLEWKREDEWYEAVKK